MISEAIKIAVAGLLGSACWSSSASATEVYSNDFSSNSNGFSGGTVTTAPSGQKFLSFGGAGGSATLTVVGLAPHSSVSLAFTLDAVGSLDGDGYNGAPIYGGGSGDYFDITYAGTTNGSLFHQAFANYGGGEVQSYPTEGSSPGAGASAINALGYTGFPADAGIQDAEYTINGLNFADSSGTISFTFSDNSNEGASNEFYGIDDVVVSTSGAVSAVPEPASWAMMIVGLGLIGVGMRYHKRKAVLRYI